MLATILKSSRAVKISVFIIKTFVKLRQILSSHKELADKLKELEIKVGQNSQDIKQIFEAINALLRPPEKPAPKIGFLRD